MIKFKILPLVYQILFLNTVLFGNNIPCPIDNFIQKINQIQQEDFDNEFSIIEKHINEISTNLDTACIIKLYQTYVRSSGGKGNYYLVFDALWRALLLADEANLNVEKFDINITIARFYGYLERYEKAEEYFEKAYKLKDHLLLDNKIINVKVINLYSPQAKMYERMGDVELAKLYLDSCDQQIAKYKLDKNYYVEHTRALLFAKEGHLKEALSIFKEIEEKMKYLNPAYLSIVYAEIGDVYYSLNQYNVSLKAYQDAIVINDQYKKHTDYSPKIYGKLATLYNKLGNYQQAYEMSEIESDLNFELFDSRSKRSSNMLKVQDNFRIYKEDEEKRIQEYELKNLRQEKRYERVLLVGSLLFLSIIAFVYFRLQKGRIKVEKALNSQLKIQNAEKEKFLKRIEKKNEELMTFSNIMSHDLKAPIKNISAFSGLIKKQVKNEFDKKKVSTFNNYIDSSAKSMLVLIEDLLLYSRISLDEQKFSKVDLNEVINSVYPAFSYDVNNGNASVNIEKLPTIWGNHGLLKTVFHNLISNAIKYQPKNDPNHKAIVNIWSVKTQNEHYIYVEDNGIGIKPDFLDKLFNAFSRYHKSSEYTGTGLGMSICKRIITNHNGGIQLDETSSEGSRFKLVFPAVKKTENSCFTNTSLFCY